MLKHNLDVLRWFSVILQLLVEMILGVLTYLQDVIATLDCEVDILMPFANIEWQKENFLVAREARLINVTFQHPLDFCVKFFDNPPRLVLNDRLDVVRVFRRDEMCF